MGFYWGRLEIGGLVLYYEALVPGDCFENDVVVFRSDGYGI
jgi:hypothetical protein